MRTSQRGDRCSNPRRELGEESTDQGAHDGPKNKSQALASAFGLKSSLWMRRADEAKPEAGALGAELLLQLREFSGCRPP
jgi:hypothetical protein